MARIMFDPIPIDLARPAAPVAVYRYDPEADQPLSVLPNVVVNSVEDREGPHPSVAHFRYQFDANAGDGRPLHFHEVMPLGAGGPLVVKPDDRLAVVYYRGDGSYEYLFEGFVQPAQAGVSGDGQDVSFIAYGSPVREWDMPLDGAGYRDSTASIDPTANRQTDLPVRFNPLVDGKNRGNCTPTGGMVGDAPNKYPIFLDENTYYGDPLQDPQKWTVRLACRYLLARGGAARPKGTVWVDTPAFDDLDRITVAWEPKDSGGTFDPADATTYTTSPIVLGDLDVTGECWIDAVWKVVQHYNLGISFAVSGDAGGHARHILNFYRKDVNNQVRKLNYQPYGETLDPGLTNVGGLTVARDTAQIANRIVVDTSPVRYEASFVLAPGFAIDPTDATLANLKKWVRGVGQKDDTVTYRDYILGEGGNSYWDVVNDVNVDDTPPPLGKLFGPKGAKPAEQEASYVRRPRKPDGDLFTADADGQPAKAQLWICTNYHGPIPGLWDGTGAWQRVTSGGWKLLDDQVGVHLTVADLQDWDIGKSAVAGDPFPGGNVRAVTFMADPPAGKSRFALRLTCVVSSDQGIDAVAEPRGVSPTSYTITRHVDARDRYFKDVISYLANTNAVGTDVLARDDTAAAKAHAAAQQRATETGLFSGTVTIPRFTRAYDVGNKLSTIAGRDMSLRVNVGGDQGEGPVYPNIVGITYNFSGQQSTTLTISDERSRPEWRMRVRPGHRG